MITPLTSTHSGFSSGTSAVMTRSYPGRLTLIRTRSSSDVSEKGVKAGKVTAVRYRLLGAHVFLLAWREHSEAVDRGCGPSFAPHYEENRTNSIEVVCVA